MISNGCLAIVYFVDFVEIIWCVKMTSKANPPEIVRNKSGERYQKQFSHFCKWKSENNVKKITEEVILAGLFFRFGLIGCTMRDMESWAVCYCHFKKFQYKCTFTVIMIYIFKKTVKLT
jgi:hypothetical protein